MEIIPVISKENDIRQEDGIAKDFHLTRAEFMIIKYGNLTLGNRRPNAKSDKG